MMEEQTNDLFGDVRPITFRNLCAASCGREHSPKGKPEGVMIPDIGMVCAECVPAGTAKFIDDYPRKMMSIPFYK